MDFPSENWVSNDWDDLSRASANVVGDYTLEIFTQPRNTGRILDNFRRFLGGSKQRATRLCTGELLYHFCKINWQQNSKFLALTIKVTSNIRS
jgi:hypothetical protein